MDTTHVVGTGQPPHIAEVTAQFVIKVDSMTNTEFCQAINAPANYLGIPEGLPKEFHAKWLAMQFMAYDAVKYKKIVDFVKRNTPL